jgi:hypothetical protein
MQLFEISGFTAIMFSQGCSQSTILCNTMAVQKGKSAVSKVTSPVNLEELLP